MRSRPFHIHTLVGRRGSLARPQGVFNSRVEHAKGRKVKRSIAGPAIDFLLGALVILSDPVKSKGNESADPGVVGHLFEEPKLGLDARARFIVPKKATIWRLAGMVLRATRIGQAREKLAHVNLVTLLELQANPGARQFGSAPKARQVVQTQSKFEECTKEDGKIPAFV